jgi:hypothetical protein
MTLCLFSYALRMCRNGGSVRRIKKKKKFISMGR